MKTLKFDSNNFDAIICLNSDLPDLAFWSLLPGLPILAADGAALRLFEKGIEPDYIIGDLDSLGEVVKSKSDSILTLAEGEGRKEDEKYSDFYFSSSLDCLGEAVNSKSNPTPTLPEGEGNNTKFDAFHNIYELKKIKAKSKIIKITDQDSSDFEKILNWSIENSLLNLLILGFHGGELEHTLNNWSILTKFSHKLNLCVFDKNRYGIPIFQSILYPCKKGEMISIIPNPIIKLITKNLEWELNSEELEFGIREGARNRSISNHIELDILNGSCLLFIDSHLPFSPAFV